ncbi:nucleotidyltransferase domain-containing protein [Thermococcus sp. Bubb.Bath]|uniref:nucleotidyltransferase domain-containing protein n=1 Tax=Thermococcus sp. Bubb.Bath TaxID=1638242 RepID=UPI001438F851|nr:nucleotidyltransferase domain-containing protein [Thermococcus sp. Bubb.Bath]NJF26083.1 nucleotidyltransferase domain-containing protein [Thermococcus sp. Bubb.Bath]
MNPRKAAVDEFLQRLKDKFYNRIDGIYLFGSYVRGNYDEESDIDILIVGELTLDGVMDDVFEVLLKYGVLLNVIVELPGQFEKWKESSFHKAIFSEGIRVY